MGHIVSEMWVIPHQMVQQQRRKLSVDATELYHSTKKLQHSFDILKLLSSDTHQSMKTSDSDLKVNRNIYPDAVTCEKMRLIVC